MRRDTSRSQLIKMRCFLSACFFVVAAVGDKTKVLDSTILELVSGTTYYGSNARDNGWGIDPKSDEKYQIVGISGQDTFACGNTTQDIIASVPTDPFLLYIPRGHCSFVHKAIMGQQLGAKGILIGDSIDAIFNSTTGPNVTTITSHMAWNCQYARDSNLANCAASTSCPSKKCLWTNEFFNEACCMWDVPDLMGGNSSRSFVRIPVMRMKASDAAELEGQLPVTEAKLYLRTIHRVDPSSFIVWFLAVATVVVGGWRGSRTEREKARGRQIETTGVSEEIEALELTKYHAIGFLVFGSAFLLILYYLPVVKVVIVMFAIGSVSAVGFIIFMPIVETLYKRLSQAPMPHWNLKWLGEFYLSDLVSLLLATGVVLWWGLERNEPYAWVLQNIFGICVCLVFLQVIHLPNIRIASILLTLVFLYDIFFVFISPYIFEESVMVKAAKGGAQAASTAPTGYCLRYPYDTEYNCLQEKIPILLRLPKLCDWQAGEVMLGLGDIVLPGLLIVFCARYDYFTRGNVWGRVMTEKQDAETPVGTPSMAIQEPRGSDGCPGRFGYFIWMCLGYAIGLIAAYTGVVLMEKAQPALLYLVPFTLGLLVFLALIHGNLKSLWDGFQHSKEEELSSL